MMGDLLQQFRELETWVQAGILGLAGVILLLVVFLLLELVLGPRRKGGRLERTGPRHSNTPRGDDDEVTEVYSDAERDAIHRELDILTRDGRGDESSFCQGCGTRNEVDATYCQACGVALDMTLARHQLGWREGPMILSVGRQDGHTIVLNDPMVSKDHAQLQFWKGTLTLQDSGSQNGSWVNDRRLEGPAMVIHGDRLRFGRTELTFDQVITVLVREIRRRRETFREGRRG